jgi:hypothetical protein
MSSKSLGRHFVLKDGKIVKKMIYSNVSQALKAKRTNRTKVRVKRPGERSR